MYLIVATDIKIIPFGMQYTAKYSVTYFERGIHAIAICVATTDS